MAQFVAASHAGPHGTVARRVVNSPMGPLTLTVAGGAVRTLVWGAAGPNTGESAVADRAAAWLAAYVDRAIPLPDDLPLAPDVTAYRWRVLEEMARIPPGETLSYGALADRAGGCAQSVGGACAHNPIPILIPCHRVLAAHGRIGMYSGGKGLPTKRWLLAHEGAEVAGERPDGPGPDLLARLGLNG